MFSQTSFCVIRTALFVALLASGFVALSSKPAVNAAGTSQKRQYVCRMKLQWDNTNDIAEFDAAYVSQSGPDDFKGKYDSPGQATATVDAASRNGTWNILFIYTDAKHHNLTKQLTGIGTKDPQTHQFTVDGDYKTFLGGTDIKRDGQFHLRGKCK